MEIRKQFFGMRIVDIWNSLPDAVVEAPLIKTFKNRMDKVLADYHFMESVDTAQVSRDLRKKIQCDLQDTDTEDAPQE